MTRQVEMKISRIRKIIFGIRFKFALVIILSITFTSVLLLFALINQHEKTMKDAIRRQGETILQGISGQAEIYLRSRRSISSGLRRHHGIRSIEDDTAKIEKSRKAMSNYFASLVGQEARKEKGRILDIAFIVDIDWSDTPRGRRSQPLTYYQYFHRLTGALFTQKTGRHDPLIGPAIMDHFTYTIDTGAHIDFATESDVQKDYRYLFKENPDFVIIALPLFREKPTLYDEYIRHKNAPLTRTSIETHLKQQKAFPVQFISRILEHGSLIDYQIDISRKTNIMLIVNFFLSRTLPADINYTIRRKLKKDLESQISIIGKNSSVPISQIESLWESLLKRYRVKRISDITDAETRYNCLSLLRMRGVPISSSLSTDQLALLSFRNDLAGLVGLFLYRKEFFPEITRSANEIINLAVSILIRVAFIAILFPAFIIRSIKKLSDGAIEIGKGRFDNKIDIRGSDEIGRLADIFNIMTLNLKKAEEMKIEKLRMENELETARQIQAALLPEYLPNLHGHDIGTYYLAQTESGGDYYDVISLGEEKLGIAIADVSGHGVGSGLVMAMTRTLLHIYCMKSTNTKKIFELINEYLKNNTASNYFVTMFYGILDMRSHLLTYSSAGHSPAMVLRKGAIIDLSAGGIALGVASSEMFSRTTEIKEFQLQPGDYFIQYTDGVDESMDSQGNEYGVDRFKKSLLQGAGKTPQKMIDGVIADIRSFTGSTPQHDDITMLICKIT
jgi:serine phosphatase RsbU (regulator of sigma subunit)